MRERVAVVGAGIAGLTAAHLLQRRYDVHLFEAEDRLGGHTHTHEIPADGGGKLAVDSGFIVFNERTYPNLIRLFGELGVESRPTEMSMSIRCEGCGLEYAGGRGAAGVFAQPRAIVNPAFLNLLREVRRFHRLATELLVAEDDTVTLGEFLTKEKFSAYFTRHFMIPTVSCVWSSAAQDALGYPARYLFSFLDNHGMLSVSGSPTWRTVVGGSHAYVQRIVKNLSAVVTSTPVRQVIRHGDGVEVRTDGDQLALFDGVVVATHADTALRLLDTPTKAELATLDAFGYSSNATWLHTDDRILPRARRAASSWNYLLPDCGANPDRVLVSYDMNRLQGLPGTTPHIVTLNALDRIDETKVLARMTYEHPIYTRTSVAAQKSLPALNDGTIAFAGAYHGWGFHEDGCLAGVAAAASLGVTW
jgi:predicted NAD/FAD-binding protein